MTKSADVSQKKHLIQMRKQILSQAANSLGPGRAHLSPDLWAGPEEIDKMGVKANDILNRSQLKIMERGSSAPEVGCCNPLLFCTGAR